MLEELLTEVRETYKVPALTAAIVQGEKVTNASAVGFRHAHARFPVTFHDKFHIGSVSKPVSATVIATLVEDNLLKWQTSIIDVFPELADQIRPEYYSVTLEALLSHRGGIFPMEEDDEIALVPKSEGTPLNQRLVALHWLLNRPPVAQPGITHVYSNAGYAIAAAMAEKVAGMSWEALVDERLGKPLGYSSLGFGWPAKEDSQQPWGHKSASDGFVPHPPDDAYQLGPLLAPAGDMHMSIIDLAAFAQLHLEGLQGGAKFLSEGMFKKLHRPFGDYALGWNVRESGNFHLGGAETFLSIVWLSVKRNVAIVIATNADADGKLLSTIINRSLKNLGIS